jgi:hypothetical protein
MSMTAARKKRLAAARTKIENLRDDIGDIFEKEIARHEGMSEARQNGDTGQTLEAHLESASAAINRLNEAIEALANIE